MEYSNTLNAPVRHRECTTEACLELLPLHRLPPCFWGSTTDSRKSPTHPSDILCVALDSSGPWEPSDWPRPLDDIALVLTIMNTVACW